MKSHVFGRAFSARTVMLAGVASIGLTLPAAAVAQAADEAAEEFDDAAASGNLIIVTATKRAKTLQDTPVAVSVTSGATIEEAQIRDIADLSTLVPSLRVNTLQNSANTSFTVRGFGNGTNNFGIEPSVAVFVDGVYRSRSVAQISDLPDVERVEVLRGPQSTLFGKNASAGVISIVTKEPSFDLNGLVEASYGNFNAVVGKAYVTGPISDTIAVSVAGGINKRDGYIFDAGYNGDANTRDRWFARGQILFEPSSTFKVRLIADYDKIDEICCAVQPIVSLNPIVNFLEGGPDSTDPFDDRTATNFASTNNIENYGFSGQVDYNFGALSLTSITAYRESRAITNQDSDFTTGDYLGSNIGDVQLKTFTQELRVASDFDGPLNFLVGGYYFDEKLRYRNDLTYGSEFRTFADVATGGLLATFEDQVLGVPVGTFYPEGQGIFDDFRLENDAYSFFANVDFEVTDRLTLTAGVNYTRDKKQGTSNTVSTDAFSALDLVAIGNQVIAQTAIATQLATNFGVDATDPVALGTFIQNNGAIFAQIQTGAQLFADANDSVSPDEAAADGDPSTTVGNSLLALRPLQFLPPFLNYPNAVEDGRTDDDDWSFTLRANYAFTDSLSGYISYATGFKSSSFNLTRDSRPFASDLAALELAGLTVNNLTTGTRFAPPEKSKVYEAGLKANWEYASANLTVFKQEIDNFQSAIFTGTGFTLVTAGKQSTFGIEFDGSVRPTPELTLSLAMTYLDPVYDDFTIGPFGDLTGETPSGIAPISATFGAQYNKELGNGDRIILRGDYNYESSVQIADGLPAFLVEDALGNVVDVQPALDVAKQFRRQVDNVNASLTYAMDMGLELTVWGRNLLNDRYLGQLFDVPAQQFNVNAYPSQPRTYGVTGRFRF